MAEDDLRIAGRNAEVLQQESIQPNPENPRLIFRQEDLEALEESIASQGILVPLTVYRSRSQYIILDGERGRAERAVRLAARADLGAMTCNDIRCEIGGRGRKGGRERPRGTTAAGARLARLSTFGTRRRPLRLSSSGTARTSWPPSRPSHVRARDPGPPSRRSSLEPEQDHGQERFASHVMPYGHS